MSTNQRGILTLVVILVFGAIFCGWLPFAFLPSQGAAVTLPIIMVPGEPYIEGWPSEDFTIVNTLGGMLLADIIVLFIALKAFQSSKGWRSEVPGRFQGFVELLVGGLWGLTKQMAGTAGKVRTVLFPLMATIFIFLLAANLGKLIPGVESVGFIHCLGGHPGLSGLPRDDIGYGYQLRNDSPLNVGYLAEEADYKVCNSFKKPDSADYGKYLPTELDPYMDAAVVHTVIEGESLADIVADHQAEAEALMAEALPDGDKYAQYTGWKAVEITEASIMEANGMAEGDELEVGQVITVRPELVGRNATTVNNQIYGVTPFVRGAATDLNLTIGLALISFFAIQAFGISTLGLNYFQKFINVHALGNLSKKPLGLIDFVAGIFEIISEIGKIISLSFRLFGAIFAGTVLYAVILFLLGTVTPVVILLLELIVGTAQAGVFSVLTLIFCAQAMVSHHGDDHGHEH